MTYKKATTMATCSIGAALMFVVVASRLPLGRGNQFDEAPSNRIGEIEKSIGFYQAIELADSSLLFEMQSKYQSIQVHQTKHFGKLLLLDGVIQLTERDAASYNEMMAHVPMFLHPNPKRVLVIGGGDGYVVKEVLKHPSVEVVDHVDLDEDVIKTCQVYFPQWGDCWKDLRVHLHIKDGAEFVRNSPDNYYDVIIQDSSDPWVVEDDGTTTALPSGALYEEDHICQLYRVLAHDGILNIQGESFNVPENIEGIAAWRKHMEDCGFKRSRYGNIMTVSYTTGHIGMLMGEKDPRSASKDNEIRDRFDRMIRNGGRTSYYHPGLQRGAFALPLWAHERIYGEEDTAGFLCEGEVEADRRGIRID